MFFFFLSFFFKNNDTCSAEMAEVKFACGHVVVKLVFSRFKLVYQDPVGIFAKNLKKNEMMKFKITVVQRLRWPGCS